MTKMKSLSDSLNAIRESVPIKVLILYAVLGLNYRYNAFVCNIIDQVALSQLRHVIVDF